MLANALVSCMLNPDCSVMVGSSPEIINDNNTGSPSNPPGDLHPDDGLLVYS